VSPTSFLAPFLERYTSEYLLQLSGIEQPGLGRELIMTTLPSDLQDSAAQSAVRIVVHPYASSLPLGCFSFGIGNVLLSAFLLHWFPASDTLVFAVMLLAFVAPLELIPCLVAFVSRDTGAATAMGLFSAGWVVQGIELIVANPNTPSPVAGLFLLLLALCLALLAAVTFSGKPLLGMLLSVAMLRSIAAGLVQMGVRGSTQTVAAILGLLVALFAFYSGFGLMLEDIKGKPIAMTFHRKQARIAMEGSLRDQMKNIANEAGVRKQL
jgi:succinate-acetate transporter protein